MRNVRFHKKKNVKWNKVGGVFFLNQIISCLVTHLWTRTEVWENKLDLACPAPSTQTAGGRQQWQLRELQSTNASSPSYKEK